ncbi:MAG: fabD, partial [Nevskia sp.]|nr:fabD [Nevskia sp.]
MQYALLFPGQGSQSVGMLAALAASDPRIDATFKEASRALDWDVARLIKEGPAEELNKTEHTQPALLAAGIAVWRVWRAEQAQVPSFLAGHSLGEYTALVAAGAMDFSDALRVVHLRGKLMQAAVATGTGGMAAVVGIDDAAVEKMCAAFPGPGVLEPANYNAPGQVVVAGSANAIEWLHANAKTFGARKVVALQMSVPSHCSLLRGAADQLAERLAQVEVRAPVIPVLHNLDAAARSEPNA